MEKPTKSILRELLKAKTLREVSEIRMKAADTYTSLILDSIQPMPVQDIPAILFALREIQEELVKQNPEAEAFSKILFTEILFTGIGREVNSPESREVGRYGKRKNQQS